MDNQRKQDKTGQDKTDRNNKKWQDKTRLE
jgi:hypothetical protein